jgi:hypothetical protein
LILPSTQDAILSSFFALLTMKVTEAFAEVEKAE